MNSGFCVGANPKGQVDFLVQEAWRPEMRQALLASGADGLVANGAHGFASRDLEFLRGLPLRRLTVLARWINDLSPVESLGGSLESVNLQVGPKAELECSAFTSLRSLACRWSTVARSMASAPPLTDLYLEAYSPDDFSPIADLTSITALRLKDHPRLRSVTGIQVLSGLQQFHVFTAPLEDISALASVETVTDLRLGSCPRLSSLDPLASLPRLRVVEVSEAGMVDSLAPLSELHRLETLDLHGSTRIQDGDLAPLLGLTRLVDLRMMSRRGYRPSVASVRSQLGLLPE